MPRSEYDAPQDFTPGERYKFQYYKDIPQEQTEEYVPLLPKASYGTVSQSDYRYIYNYKPRQSYQYYNYPRQRYNLLQPQRPVGPDQTIKEQEKEWKEREHANLYTEPCRWIFYKGQWINTCDVQKKTLPRTSAPTFIPPIQARSKKYRLHQYRHNFTSSQFRSRPNNPHKRYRFTKPRYRNRWY